MASGADVLVEHITNCTDAKALIVIDGNGDVTVASLLAAGWTLEERVDVIAGKRIRFMRTPGKADDQDKGTETQAPR